MNLILLTIQNLGAYEFDITYNENIIQIASNGDIVAGTNGFLDTVNIDHDNGLVTITGFDSMGKGPSSQLHSTKLIWFWNLYLDKVIVIFMGGFNG